MAQVVSTELNMGVNTSCVPYTQASARFSPFCQRWVMLSMVMIELSTIIPRPSTSPDSDMMLMDMCRT